MASIAGTAFISAAAADTSLHFLHRMMDEIPVRAMPVSSAAARAAALAHEAGADPDERQARGAPPADHVQEYGSPRAAMIAPSSTKIICRFGGGL